MRLAVLVVLLGASASLPAVSVDPAPCEAIPDLERAWFDGSYVYYGTHAVNCVFTRPRGDSGAFDVHWSAYWPNKDKGENDDGWYSYRGPMTISDAGEVSGKAKYYTFSGTAAGDWPGLDLELVYTGGRKDYDGERSVRLRPSAKPGAKTVMQGRIVAVDLGQGAIQVAAPAAGRSAPMAAAAEAAEPDPKRVVITRDTAVQVGRYRVSAAVLQPGMQVKIGGYATAEGLLAVQLAAAEAEIWVGSIASVAAEGTRLAVQVRPKRDRKAELLQVELDLQHCTHLRPADGRLRTMPEARANLAAGQQIECGAVAAADGKPGCVIWLKASGR